MSEWGEYPFNNISAILGTVAVILNCLSSGARSVRAVKKISTRMSDNRRQLLPPSNAFLSETPTPVRHRGYAKYLETDNLMDDASDMVLFDELVFRAHTLSGN